MWETSLSIGGTLFVGNVIAKRNEEAYRIADARELGETVDFGYPVLPTPRNFDVRAKSPKYTLTPHGRDE